jgi:beta-lactam-binding protein with PASTA domain
VMLTRNGQVKVMDFGIARALASGATTMTQTSAVIGTAQYLSPEQARGEAVDARSDVYAAGCVLFELLVGHPPFVGDSPVSVAYQHVREDPRPPSDINPEVPPDVDAIVLKALAKNPLNRYQSAQEMRADALRAVAGRPVLATPVMPAAETMAMTGPTMRQQATATTVTRPVPGMPPRPPERKTSSWVMAVLAALGVLAVVALGIGLALANRNNGDRTETPPTVSMPSLIGKTEDEARSELARQNFSNVSVGAAIENDDCDTPTVQKQSPVAGQSIRVDQAVSFQLCKAPDQVRVPDNLVGSTREAAAALLTQAGLQADFKNVDSDKPVNTVTAVDKAGQQVDKGTTIKVSISRGNLVPVPSVLGKTQQDAIDALQQAGLNANVQQGDPSPQPGLVVAQSPGAGKKLAKGRSVTIVISQPEPNPGNSGTPSSPPDGNGGGDDGDPLTELLR